MIGSNDGIYIDAPIIIDEPEALTFLHSTKPMIIVPDFYQAIPEMNGLVLPILGIYNGN
ncbi:MAG: hypothetical protein ACI3Z7_02005 [Candidatus Aphodosoma sp.]